MTFLNTDECSKFRSEITATGVHFLFTGYVCKDQTEHNDVQYRPDNSPGYSMIANGPEEGKFMCAQVLITISTMKRKKKSFLRELFRWSRLFYHLFLCLLEIGKCNMRALSTLVTQTFVTTFKSSLKISSYPMPLHSAVAVAPQLESV